MAEEKKETNEGSSDEGSITNYLREAKLGRVVAIERLTDSYMERLEQFALRRMSSNRRQVEDEQDIANRVLHEFFAGYLNGKYEGLRNREQLWRLLARMTVSRVYDHYEKYSAAKRGSGEIENLGAAKGESSNAPSIEQLKLDDSIEPQLEVGLKESYNRVINGLTDHKDKIIVQMLLEGATRKEIAKKIRSHDRTVRNRIDEIIRKLIADMKEST